MKTAILCVVCGIGAFVLLQFQLGGRSSSEPAKAEVPTKEPARFPEDLAPAARGAPIPDAAVFTSSDDPHPTAILTPTGRLHDWHQRQPSDWQAQSVETTELVLLMGEQRETVVQVVSYAGGAPPVTRCKYELDVRLQEARTGKVLAHKRFVSLPRAIRPIEPWDLTHLGDPVECREVNEWLRAKASRLARETTSVVRK